MARKAIKDPYAVLGVARSADAQAIMRAYRRRALETHPDHGGDADAFHDVAEANRVLSDPVKRLTYDRTGEVDDVTQSDDAVAMSMIATLLEQLLAREHDRETWTTDIVAVLRASLERSQDQLTKVIAGMKRQVVRNTRLAKKFTVKTGHNLLRGMIERKVADLEVNVADAERHARAVARALELLQDHAFEVDTVADRAAGESLGQLARRFGMVDVTPS